MSSTWKGSDDVEGPVKMFIPDTVREYLLESFSNTQLATFASRATLPPYFTTLRLNTLSSVTQEEQQQRIAELRNEVKAEYAEKGFDDPGVHLVYEFPALESIALIKNIPSTGGSTNQHQNDVFVDELCGCALLRGADVFVNGILGAADSLQVSDLVRVFAVCDRHYKKGSKVPYRGDLPSVYVGSGISRVDRDMLFKKNKLESGVAVRMSRPRIIAPSLSSLDNRIWIAQNLPSLVCALNVEAQPGDRILDMCAAPGGKCLHLAALIKNQGRIIALDRSKAKIETLKGKLEALGVTCIRAFACDSTTINRTGTLTASEHALAEAPAATSPDCVDMPPFSPDSFDRILLDAPCSNLGQRPRFMLTEHVDALRSYATVQRRLFEVACSLLKPGGTLVYSTCTLNVDENERLVAWALDRFRGTITLVKQRVHLGGSGAVFSGAAQQPTGLTEQQATLVQKFDFTNETDPESQIRSLATAVDGDARILDAASSDTIGFFIAKFQKL